MEIKDLLKGQVLLAGPDLPKTGPETSASEALQEMADFGVHAISVFRGEVLEGIVSDRDILSRIAGKKGFGVLSGLRVSEIMRKDFPVIQESTAIGEALFLMVDGKSDALPIVKNGKVVGLVTENDMLRMVQRIVPEKHRIENAIAKGESLLANPFAQSLIGLLSEIGI